MVQSSKNYIDGAWIASKTRKTFVSTNPATGQVLGRFQASDERDVTAAIHAAEKAFSKWRLVPAPKRGEILLRVAQLLRAKKEEFSRLVTIEMGKVIAEGRGDVQEAIDFLEYIAGEGRRMFGYTTPSELPNKFAMSVRDPIGVCGLITPWNFPIAIPSWKIAPALLCGNTIVFKPASDTPLSALRFTELFIKAGLPKGVLNVVTGGGTAVGSPLVKHKNVRCISFTGSRDTGDWITKNAGIKRVSLELGGKNVIIVMDDADLNLAVDGVIWGGYGTTGQRCTATSRVVVHQKVKATFERMLLNRTKRLRLGNGIHPKTDVGPMINKAAIEKSQRYVEIGKQEGAKLLTGGKPIRGRGHFFQPTLFTNTTSDMRICQEEIFGPVVSLMVAKNLDHAIDLANNITYGLSSAIYTRNVNNAFTAMRDLESGVMYVNASTIGAEVHLPFGGIKGTGNGAREGGWTAIEEFSEHKAIYVDYSGTLQRAQIDV
ncbi:MAG: aldehyde dehydrogenase family protein [Nanoarchaeota archaeon]|nr:aldehyde dehydrogenase family protein [Nanoarchaeota archaeon]